MQPVKQLEASWQIMKWTLYGALSGFGPQFRRVFNIIRRLFSFIGSILQRIFVNVVMGVFILLYSTTCDRAKEHEKDIDFCRFHHFYFVVQTTLVPTPS